MSTFRDQQSVEADAPRVLLYKNYVMYDRWMSYKRFNSYYQDESKPWETDDDERQYYNKNLMNFLVLKFRMGENRYIGKYDVILLDANYQNIYILGDYVHVCETEVSDFDNEYFGTTFPVTRIVACRPPDIECLSINDDGIWCNNIHKNQNGYCDEHQHQSREFEDIDLDRLLTFGELLNLPEFSRLLNFNFHVESDEQKYDDDDDDDNEPCRRYHTFDSDTDFYDSDDYKYDCDSDDDYDDRRHGPENTIEDDETEEKEENNTEEKKDEHQLTEEIACREKQEIAELQEQAIMEDEWNHREYVQEQLEKLEQEKIL